MPSPSKDNSLKRIYIVVCNGISDIGKGWLTASIAGLDPNNTVTIKIDPLLNLEFPQHLGVPIQDICTSEDVNEFIKQGRADSGNFKISEDFLTYHKVGVSVYPECNIVAGDLINRFLNSPNVEIRPNEIKKRTFSDLSRFLAEEITKIVKKRKPQTLIIEVGGTIEDKELIYIPGAFRFLGDSQYLGIIPEIIFLTYFEFADSYDPGKYRIKTQYIRRGIIDTTRTYYNLPLKACFVRRRSVPNHITDDVLIKDLKNVAHETQLPPQRIIYLPNVTQRTIRENLQEITNIINNTGIFN